ncbi:MAG: signal peptidase I [Ruminococcus sp.]|nr:signal peptidase I [Ruminococcus sp.]
MNAEKKQTEQTQTSKGYKVFSIVRSVIVYLFAFCIIIGALLFASSKNPNKSLFGYRYYTVLTPSMEPKYSEGDMVFVKLCGAGSIDVGDVITFNPSSGGDAYLTHRVTQKIEDYQGSGVTCFRTKGDANDSEDSFLIDEDRVIGVVKFHVPHLGHIVRFIQLRWYFVIPFILLIAVFFHLMQLYFAPPKVETETVVNTGEISGSEKGDDPDKDLPEELQGVIKDEKDQEE